MRRLSWGLMFGGLGLGVFSLLVSQVLVPKAMERKIKEKVQIKNGSETFHKWYVPSMPIYFSVTLFNVTNPRDIIKGKKPILQEVGPYVYEEKRQKLDVKWNEDETRLSYRQSIHYFFRSDLSSGSQDDILTFPNVPLISLRAKMDDMPIFVRSLLADVIADFSERLFIQRSVRELLFEGYHQPMIAFMEKLKNEKMLKNETFGLFYPKNGTAEGPYEIYSGVGDHTRFGQVISWMNQTELTFWPNSTYCNMINGSDGSIFPPFVTKDRVLRVFSGDLCRSAYFTFESDSSFKGVPTYRFTFPKDMLESPEENADNICYCPNPERNTEEKPFAGCQKGGTHSLSICQKGAPIVMSFPHFYNGDPALVEAIGGMKPDYDKHATFIELEPITGMFLQIKKRVQINVQLSKTSAIYEFRKLQKNLIFPLLWLEETVTIGDDGVELIKGQLLGTLEKVQTGKTVGVYFGFVVTLIGVGIIIFDAKYKIYV